MIPKYLGALFSLLIDDLPVSANLRFLTADVNGEGHENKYHVRSLFSQEKNSSEKLQNITRTIRKGKIHFTHHMRTAVIDSDSGRNLGSKENGE